MTSLEARGDEWFGGALGSALPADERAEVHLAALLVGRRRARRLAVPHVGLEPPRALVLRASKSHAVVLMHAYIHSRIWTLPQNVKGVRRIDRLGRVFEGMMQAARLRLQLVCRNLRVRVHCMRVCRAPPVRRRPPCCWYHQEPAVPAYIASLNHRQHALSLPQTLEPGPYGRLYGICD